MPDQHDLPPGVLRWTPEFDTYTGTLSNGQRIEMFPSRGGGFVKLSDLKAIRAAAVEEEREWLREGLEELQRRFEAEAMREKRGHLNLSLAKAEGIAEALEALARFHPDQEASEEAVIRAAMEGDPHA